MNQYFIPLPPNELWQDVLFAAVTGGTIPQPDGATSFTDGTTVSLLLQYNTTVLTPAQLSALATLAATNPQPAKAPYRLAATGQANLAGASPALRALAQTAATTNATSVNVVAVVNGILSDLVPLLNHMADFCDTFGLGQ